MRMSEQDQPRLHASPAASPIRNRPVLSPSHANSETAQGLRRGAGGNLPATEPVLPRAGSYAAGTPQPHGRIPRPALSPPRAGRTFLARSKIDSGRRTMPGHAKHAADTASVRERPAPDMREPGAGSDARLAAQ